MFSTNLQINIKLLPRQVPRNSSKPGAQLHTARPATTEHTLFGPQVPGPQIAEIKK